MKYITGILMSLALGSFAQKPPHHCKSPPVMTGHFTMISQKLHTFANAKYVYDAFDQRIRIKERGTYDNTTFHYDALLYYKEHVVYVINEQNRTCVKQPLKGNFHPMEIPQNATLLGTEFIGSSSNPLEGLYVSTWTGELPEEKAEYQTTFTMFGCIPVLTVYHTDRTGWTSIRFYNNVLGIENPDDLYPPSYCQVSEQHHKQEPADFYSLFTTHI